MLTTLVLATTLFFAGDSTLDDHKRDPKVLYASWGTALERHMRSGNRVDNRAKGGASTKSFIAEGRWAKLIADVKPGDFVAIAFGHNDQKRSTEEYRRTRWCDPKGAFRENVRGWVADVRAKGATPILMSPIVRATFDAEGRRLVDPKSKGDGVCLGSYREAMAELSKELGCDYVDMNTLTRNELERIGEAAAMSYFFISTGICRGKDGEPSNDRTHPVAAGAEAFARLFLRDVTDRGLSVAGLFDANSWRATPRDFFTRQVYGVRPVERPADLRFDVRPDRPVLQGAGIHRKVVLSANGPRGRFSFEADAYLPKGAKSVPSFVYVYLGQRQRKEGFDPSSERPQTSSFPVDRILARGFAAVTFSNWQVAMDDAEACFTTGVFRAWSPASDAARGPEDWGAISAWAWGASRVLDWIETDSAFDARRVAVIGHSRGGKTALWAGVTDARFALACVNDSGCSGAKLNRMDLPDSEHVGRITQRFPHWFAKNWRAYAGRDAEVPFDQDRLIALMAPRRVAVASATEDAWAGPRGEFAAALQTSSAWETYGMRGLVAPQGFPEPGVALQEGRVSYHLRKGVHDLTPEDWDHYMDFAEQR